MCGYARRWPNDLEAVRALKTAFYLRLASLLEDQAELQCEVHPRALCVQCDGFTFVAAIHHEPTLSLLSADGDADGVARLRWRTTAGAAHMASLSALGRRFPAFGPSVRLAKRWLSCQLYSGIFRQSLVELLVAHAFASPTERPPGSAMGGFARFLRVLATYDFSDEPLLLGFETPITSAQREVACTAFAAARDVARDDPASTGHAAATTTTSSVPAPPLAAVARPTIWVGSDVDVHGAAGCADGPAWEHVQRMRHIAAAALERLDHGALLAPTSGEAFASGEASVANGAYLEGLEAPKDAAAAAADATDRTTQALTGQLFQPPTSAFDALLELSAAELPTAHLSWPPGKSSTETKARARGAFANVSHGEIGRGIGDDPVSELVDRLTQCYGSIAIFFYDQYGGRVIAIKWRPAAFMPMPLRAATAQHRILIGRTMLTAESGGEHAKPPEPWTLPNISDLLASMVQMGGGLIKKASLPRSSHGF